MAENFSDDTLTHVLTINNDLKGPGNKARFELMLDHLKNTDYLNAREADEIEDFQELFNTLKKKDKIRPGNIKPLLQGLGDIGRPDLQTLLRDAPNGIVQGGYESKKPQTKQPQTAREVPVGPSTAPYPVMPPSEEIMGEEVPVGPSTAPNPVMPPSEEIRRKELSQCISVVVKPIGKDWRELGRQLNLEQFDFDQIVAQHSLNLLEQIHSMLELWKKRNGAKATKASLVAALRKCGMNLAADKAEMTTTTE